MSRNFQIFLRSFCFVRLRIRFDYEDRVHGGATESLSHLPIGLSCGGCGLRRVRRKWSNRRKAATGGICLCPNRREDQRTWGLARKDAGESARSCTRGRPCDCRRVEVERDSRLVSWRDRVHGRDVQERCQDDVCQRSCAEGSFSSIQLQPRRECQTRHRHPRRREDR